MKFLSVNEHGFDDKFKELIEANGVLYSDLTSEMINLKNNAGVYHFFSISDKRIASLYVGKASKGNKGNWGLYERLRQHTHVSQTDTLPGAISRQFGCTNEEAMLFLSKGKVYLQVVILNENKYSNELLLAFEKYCIERLSPVYTVM